MPPNCADVIENQKSFRIKHEDDKFFTRLLSKENSKSSFRVYYGDVSSAVPFTWETCPGTPKHNSSSDHHHVNLMPPLTPPPSYFNNNNNNLDINDSFKRNSSRSKILLHNLLRRMNTKKLPSSCHVAPTSSSPHDVISSSSLSSLSWSSSARSSFSDPISTPNYVRKRRRFSSWGSSFDDRASAISSVRNDDVSPPANSCFGIGKDKSDGGYSVFIVKKAFLSIVGRGRASSA